MATEEHTLFGELAKALMSWRVDTSGDQKNLWMHKWDIRLLTNRSGLDTIVRWLEYYKDPNYARAFESKFKHLYKSNDDFYDELMQDKLGEERARHERIQLLKDEGTQLAQHVSDVGYFCLNDPTIQRRMIGDEDGGKKQEEQIDTENGLGGVETSEVELPARTLQAYQSYEYAVAKLGESVTDKKAYEWLEECGLPDYELPSYESWARYVRQGRKHHRTQKNTRRSWRHTGRSIIRPDQVEDLAEITSQYSPKAD